MAIVDWYEVLDRQAVGGQEFLNVWHVLRADASVTAARVAAAYWDTLVDPIRAEQPDDLTHESVQVRNLGNPLDFAELARLPNGGALATDPLPSFNAVAVQFNRTRTDMKHGMKRFFAGAEDRATAGVWSAGFLGAFGVIMLAAITAWEEVTAPGVPVCNYGILKRICTVDPPPTPCPSYRLPETDEEIIFYIPLTFAVKATVRSQVSRKRLV